MPLYPYVCDSCEHSIEVYQNIEDRKLRKCPACQKPKLSRRIAAISANQVFVQPDMAHRMWHFPKAGSPRMKGLPEPPNRDKQGFGYCANEREAARHEANMARAGHPTKFNRPNFGRGKKA